MTDIRSFLYGCCKCKRLADPDDGVWSTSERRGQVVYTKSHYCKEHKP